MTFLVLLGIAAPNKAQAVLLEILAPASRTVVLYPTLLAGSTMTCD